ncbi:MAG: ATP-binding cassette domain-containing protein [Ruminococcus sp.]|nr:ATP-binding cassette domain-containing protein [Ruminococcus sp.]
MEFILTTENLTKKYGDKVAAGNINIRIREGEIYGLIGRNGAGKTTIMRMISGLSKPTSGSYTYHGDNKAGIGVLIESPGIYPKRSAFDNLKIKCIAKNCYTKEYVDGLLETVGLADTGKKPAGSFSLGMRQRLGIALALAGDPKLIVLDEPINGLDPQGIAEIRQTLEKLRDEKGITVMVSSHILDELGKIADSYGIINQGVLIDEFTNEELIRRCGKYINIVTNDNNKALDVIRSMGIDTVSITGNCVRVDEGIERAAEINRTLVNGGIDVHELHVSNISLEDYYFSLTGGNRNE